MIDYSHRINILKERQADVRNTLERVQKELDTLIARRDLLEKLKKIFIQSSILGKESARKLVESSVTDGLSAIGFSNLQFVVQDSTSHGKAGCVFKLNTGNHSSGLQCFGGGIRNIISTILRFIFAEFTYPKLSLPLILDEVGSNLSKEYQEKFGELLSVLSRRFNRQVILISHQPNVVKHADRIITLNLQGDFTHII